MATLKTCFKCGEEKPVTEFYAHPRMGDGLLGKCKECTKIDVRRNRAANEEYYRDYDRQRFQDPKRREYQREVLKALRKKYPEKSLARGAVSYALRSGKLTALPCWACGKIEAEAHHPDYSMPLDVVWLCKEHHWEAHRIAIQDGKVY